MAHLNSLSTCCVRVRTKVSNTIAVLLLVVMFVMLGVCIRAAQAPRCRWLPRRRVERQQVDQGSEPTDSYEGQRLYFTLGGS